MNYKKHFLIALAISFALHLLVVTGPGWSLPTFDDLPQNDEAPPLDAHLVAHPAPVAVAPARPKPNKPRRTKPAKSAPARPAEEVAKVSPDDTAPLASNEAPMEPPPVEPQAVEPQAVDTTEPEPPIPEAPPVAMRLPSFVRIEYQVTMGESAFGIGWVIQEIRHDGVRYLMRNSAETTGFAWLLRPVKIVNISAGDIVAGGLRPTEFRVERSDGKNEQASFDWPAGEVRRSNQRRFPLEPGTQDMLSLFAQLSIMTVVGDTIALPVATGKQVERYEFSVLGNETIATPRGDRETLHLRNRQPDSKETTEVWLGLADARLPIKIRHIDRRGDIFDQTAVRIEFEETKEGSTDAHH